MEYMNAVAIGEMFKAEHSREWIRSNKGIDNAIVE
jgi:hypothetical protein